MPLSWSLAAVPLLIALNAFFVVSEYAVVATRPAQVQMLRTRGRLAAANAMDRLKDDPTSAIGAIQVCITQAAADGVVTPCELATAAYQRPQALLLDWIDDIRTTIALLCE